MSVYLIAHSHVSFFIMLYQILEVLFYLFDSSFMLVTYYFVISDISSIIFFSLIQRSLFMLKQVILFLSN